MTYAPVVTGVVLVDVSSAVDDLELLDARAAAGLVPADITAGAPVRLDVGRTRVVVGGFGLVVSGLRNAGSIEVVGQEPAGIADVTRRLRLGTMRSERAS